MNRSNSIVAAVALSATMLSALAIAADMEHQHATSMALPALDRLKKLDGEWVGKAGVKGGEVGDARVIYHTTANGTAVIETLFPGAQEEMVTVYTVEGGQLALTHYCAAGNQPRMKSRKDAAANEVAFEFVATPGIDPKSDAYMRTARITFVDDDHVKTEWASYDKGKPSHVMQFDLTRKN